MKAFELATALIIQIHHVVSSYQAIVSDRPGVTMHPAQPDKCQNRKFVKILKVSSKLPKIMLILKD